MSVSNPPDPIQVFTPGTNYSPCIFSVPHSGRYYPKDFIAQSQLDFLTLRRSEDCFVDELFASAPDCGAYLLNVNYPRAYVDVNREPYELDAKMYNEALPFFANTRSERVLSGLGTIPRIVGAGLEIYARPFSYKVAEQRLRAIYTPFHEALKKLINITYEKFGFAVVIDCHSMPSPTLNPLFASRRKEVFPDIVLGDRFGTSCAPFITAWLEEQFTAQGLNVARNTPYAGGYIARTYSAPHKNIHVIQIEIARALYMNEHGITKHSGFGKIEPLFQHLTGELTEVARSWATHPPTQAEAAE